MEQSIQLERRFAIIDEWLLDLDISDRAVRLYAVLARYADSETHKAYPSRNTLAERLRCSKASVDRAAQELIDAGAMTKKQRHNSSLIYTLRVSSPLHRGVVTGDEGGSAPMMRGVLTGDDLTITTELEPKEEELLNKTKTKTADDYEPAETLLAEFREKFPHVNLVTELQKFRDHHMAKGSKFSLWDRAFRKWITQAAEWNKPARNTQREKPLTNNQRAALLAMKYREEAQKAKELEAPVNPQQVKEITDDATSWLKGIDND